MLKKLLPLLLLSFFFFDFCEGQTSVYHPFPDSNAVWNVRIRTSCINPADYCEQIYSYLITADTIIGSNSYHKLSVPIIQRVATGITCSNCTGFWTGGDAGFIRQDIPAKKVYYIEPGNNVELLLYDFNMQVGDTVRGYIETACSSNPDVVSSIDSILIGSSYRKRWDLNAGNYLYLIEGVGLTVGIGTIANFLGTSDCGFIDAPGPVITCFVQNDTILYHPYPSYACDVITNIKDISENNNSIIIYPNPFTNEIGIMIKDSGIREEEIILYDVAGKEILRQKTTGAETKLNTERIAVAFYLLRVGRENFKVVKESR